MEHIINKLILSVGLWMEYREEQFAKEFERLIDELSRVANTSQDGAIKIFVEEVEAREGVGT